MWNRAGLKANAKENLKNFYWSAFLVCIIVAIFNGGGGGASGGYSGLNSGYDRGSSSLGSTDFISMFNPLMLGIALSVIIGIIVIAMAVSLFIGNPLLIGKNRFFMCNRDAKTGVGEIGYAFSSNYWNVVKTMFFMQLFTFLWSLLFIIPGIIKSYEYAMIPYILAENPDIDSKRAFELSKEMMMGQKWNYFVLQISFILWFLLGIIVCCGLGLTFIQPYFEATYAEFYGWAREKMITSGFSNSFELSGFGEVKEL